MRLNLYDSILFLIENNYINGRKLKFNYDRKIISYSGKTIVSSSRCLFSDLLGIPVKDGLSLDVKLGNSFIETLEFFYGEYYVSERQHTRGINFVAKKSDNSSDIGLFLQDKEAEYKRVRLEAFLYCVIVGDLYHWEFGERWYWVSNKYRKLYLYKKWFLI